MSPGSDVSALVTRVGIEILCGSVWRRNAAHSSYRHGSCYCRLQKTWKVSARASGEGTPRSIHRASARRETRSPESSSVRSRRTCPHIQSVGAEIKKPASVSKRLQNWSETTKERESTLACEKGQYILTPRTCKMESSRSEVGKEHVANQPSLYPLDCKILEYNNSYAMLPAITSPRAFKPHYIACPATIASAHPPNETRSQMLPARCLEPAS